MTLPSLCNGPSGTKKENLIFSISLSSSDHLTSEFYRPVLKPSAIYHNETDAIFHSEPIKSDDASLFMQALHNKQQSVSRDFFDPEEESIMLRNPLDYDSEEVEDQLIESPLAPTPCRLNSENSSYLILAHQPSDFDLEEDYPSIDEGRYEPQQFPSPTLHPVYDNLALDEETVPDEHQPKFTSQTVIY